MNSLIPVLLSSNVLLVTCQPDPTESQRTGSWLTGQLGRLEGVGAGPEQQYAKSDLKREQQMSAYTNQPSSRCPRSALVAELTRTRVLTNGFWLMSHL